MEILPDELVALLFNTPPCVFVCRRICALLKAAYEHDGYYILKTGVGDTAIVEKLVGVPQLTCIKEGWHIVITYGRPILTLAGNFSSAYIRKFLVVEGDGVCRLYDVCNAVAGFNWYAVDCLVWRLSPGGFARVGTRLTVTESAPVPVALDQAGTGDVIVYTGPNDRTGTKTHGVNFRDSSTWSREVRCLSMTGLHNIVTKMLYSGQFAGIVDEIPVVVI